MGDDDTTNVLEAWTSRLADELGVGGLEFDLDTILDLAGEAAHAVVRPAAPLTTFLVGYAAGKAVASGEARASAAIQDAVGRASALCREAEPEV